MCMYVCMRICVYACVCTCVLVRMHLYVRVHVRACIGVHVYVRAFLFVYVLVCMYVCAPCVREWMCTCEWMYTCTCVRECVCTWICAFACVRMCVWVCVSRLWAKGFTCNDIARWFFILDDCIFNACLSSYLVYHCLLSEGGCQTYFVTLACVDCDTHLSWLGLTPLESTLCSSWLKGPIHFMESPLQLPL